MRTFIPENNIIKFSLKKKVSSGDGVKDVFPYTQSLAQNSIFVFFKHFCLNSNVIIVCISISKSTKPKTITLIF